MQGFDSLCIGCLMIVDAILPDPVRPYKSLSFVSVAVGWGLSESRSADSKTAFARFFVAIFPQPALESVPAGGGLKTNSLSLQPGIQRAAGPRSTFVPT
jgi:hypothetical protein